MTSRKPLVYIIAPFTNPDPIENTHKAIELGTVLRNEGIVTPLVPHLCLSWHLVNPSAPVVWYQYTMELLSWCHAAIRLDRTQYSKGSDAEEKAAADFLKIPVFHDKSELYSWVANVWPEL